MKQKICAAVLSAAMLICAYGTAVFASTDNIALNAQCTTNSQNGQHVAGRAVDGNLSTRWQAIWKETAPWIIIDLGEEKTFNKISLTTTVPQYLTSYKVEAADDADFTANVVNVTDGAGSAAQTVYKNLFSAVNKRYVKVSFVTPNGLAISEIELYNTDIVSIAVDDEYQGVAVPEESGAANHADAPAVTLTDETGDSFAAPSGAVRWSLNESYDGVSIDGLTGEITVTNTANAGTVSVRAELASDTAKYVDKTLEISKEDGTNVNFAHAFELTVTNSYSPDTEANLNDESYDTVWESGNDTVSSFTFKTNGKPLNKLLAYFGSFDGVTGFCVSAADSADFSDAEVLASKDDFKERTAVSFRETSKEYIKLEIIHTKEISLKEIELYKMTPYVIEFAKGYGTVVIPAEGGESITVKHDAVVADKHGDAVDSSNCTVTYELQGYGAEGLSLNGEDGTITVENNAVDGIYSVQASMPDYSYIQPVMLPIDLKPDVLNGADSINFALGKEVRVTSEHGSHPKGNAVDGSVKTRWQTTSKDLNPTITLDLGNTYCFNKMSMLTSASVAVPIKTGVIETADADMEIKAALVSNPEVSVSYTACLTNEYAGNVSLHKGYYVTMPTLVNSDGENTEILSEASALVFDAVGIQEGKTDTLLFIVTSYTDSSKKTLSAVNVYSVPIAEFENNTYSLPFTGLEDKQGKISVFVWNGISASSPVLEVIEY